MIAPIIVAPRSEVDQSMWLLNDAALVEIRSHGTAVTRLVPQTVDAKFASASHGSSAEQARVNGLVTSEQ